MEGIAELWASIRSAALAAWEAAAPFRAMAFDAFAGLAGWMGRADLALPRDIAIVATVCLAALSIPAILQAYVDRRAPVIGLAMAVAAVALGMWTWQAYPGDWTFRDMPMAFVNVTARILD